MPGFKDLILIDEIVLQVKIAKRANERLLAMRNEYDQVEVWCSIQSILIAAGNVSKILWPGQKHKARGDNIRKLLKVKEDNLLSDRTFRNHFEHYDERIDEWFNERPPRVYIDLIMNPSLQGFSSANHHRGYNTYDHSVMFRGERIDLNKVLEALNEVLGNCRPYARV